MCFFCYNGVQPLIILQSQARYCECVASVWKKLMHLNWESCHSIMNKRIIPVITWGLGYQTMLEALGWVHHLIFYLINSNQLLQLFRSPYGRFNSSASYLYGHLLLSIANSLLLLSFLHDLPVSFITGELSSLVTLFEDTTIKYLFVPVL